MTRFGFEAEFEVGATEMVNWLYVNQPPTRDLIRTIEPHRYHCECDDCAIIPLWEDHVPAILRAQRDSTCSGEIVSVPFESLDEAVPVFAQMEQAAVETDAVPGMNAGFHVHVSVDDMSADQKYNAFFEWLRWEPVFEWIAQGRFPYMRAMNQSCCAMLHHTLLDWHGSWEREGRIPRHQPRRAVLDVIHTRPDGAAWKRSLYAAHRDNDRHSYLSTRTRFNTWEFRLWSSTRSAWRMHLWCELSHLWMNPEWVAALGTFVGDTATAIDTTAAEHLVTTLTSLNMQDTANRLTRQVIYLRDKAESAPESLAVVA